MSAAGGWAKANRTAWLHGYWSFDAMDWCDTMSHVSAQSGSLAKTGSGQTLENLETNAVLHSYRQLASAVIDTTTDRLNVTFLTEPTNAIQRSCEYSRQWTCIALHSDYGLPLNDRD